MHIAQLGDRVRVKYARVPEAPASESKTPEPRMVEFTVGSRKVMRGLSRGVIGMAQGEAKRLRLEPADAHGRIRERLIRDVPRVRLSKHPALHVGSRLGHASSPGHRRIFRVVEIKPDLVVVDGNHPLAGQAITLDVQLISVDTSANANRSRPQFDMGGES